MIVSSTYQMDSNAQIDGRYYVTESHTDSEGVVYRFGPYLVPQGFDMSARLAEQASQLEAYLAEQEAGNVMM